MVASTDIKQGFARRLQEALLFHGIPDDHNRRSWMRKKWNISSEAARKWLMGLAMPKTSRIPQIAHDLGVRAEWMLSETGDMPADAQHVQESRAIYTLDAREARLIEQFRKADDRTKNVLDAVADAVVEPQPMRSTRAK